MKNCALTKFAGVSDNPDLEYFDALQFKIKFSTYGGVGKRLVLYDPNANVKFQFGGDGVRVKILSNGHIVNASNEFIDDDIVITSATQYGRYIKAVDESEFTEFLLIGLSKITKLWASYVGDFVIRDPYKLKYVQKGACNDTESSIVQVYYPYPGIEDWDLSYLNDIITDVSTITEYRRQGVNVSGEDEYAVKYHSKTTDWANWTSLTSIIYGMYVKEGDCAALSVLTNLTNLNLRFPGVYGDIASLGTLTKLNDFNLYGSNVTGTIESFVASLVNHGKTTGSINCHSNGKITFNGAVIPTNSSGYIIAWTSASDITVTAR